MGLEESRKGFWIVEGEEDLKQAQFSCLCLVGTVFFFFSSFFFFLFFFFFLYIYQSVYIFLLSYDNMGIKFVLVGIGILHWLFFSFLFLL